MLFDATNLRERMQRYKLNSAASSWARRGSSPSSRPSTNCARTTRLPSRVIEERQELSRLGKDAEIGELRTLYKQDTKNLRARLAVLAPKAPASGDATPPQASPADLAIAQAFATKSAAERHDLMLSMLAGSASEWAEALARSPGALSGLNPACTPRCARVSIRWTPGDGGMSKPPREPPSRLSSACRTSWTPRSPTSKQPSLT